MNAGGVIKMAGALHAWTAAEIEARTRAIGPRLADIFARAKATGETPNAVAEALARARL